MATYTLDDAGNLLIPSTELASLGLKAGDRVVLEVLDGALHVVPAPKPAPVQAPVSFREVLQRKNLETPLTAIKGVGPKLAESLARRQIATVEDALYLLPHRYEDRRELRPIARLRPGLGEAFHGKVVSVDSRRTRSGRPVFEAIVSDSTGSIVLKWFNFNLRFMKSAWTAGREGIFSGEVSQFGAQREVHHPDVEWLKPGEMVADAIARHSGDFGRILPVYPLTEGVTQKGLRKIQKAVVEGFSSSVPEAIPAAVRSRQRLLPLPEALREVHLPPIDADVSRLNEGETPAQRTLIFDEFFWLELGMALKRHGIAREDGISFQVTHRYTKKLAEILPFRLTDAQRRVLAEIKDDMMAPHPMHRLVQGDVGSGKTIVALMAALVAVENEYQVAIMAPTEILAEQHYLNIHRWCEGLGIRTVLLTSGMKGKMKKEALESVSSGFCSIVVGTHAVIQDKVEFHRLGLGIIDEQHRFGVLQRGLLKKKGGNPDILVMTATPIPRTLAMTVFGDLSISVIDQLPPGRTPIETRVVGDRQRRQVYRLIEEEVRAGRQAYIIYPLVEESEKIDLKGATEMAESLAGDVFPELRVGLLHGRLKPEEKEEVMRSFKERRIDILVATTVIEVGIDVPNATVMVIEHAERFGLSQLHQLRGRVGRGSEKSRCILMAGDRLSVDGRRRLQVMEETTDGFRIAEADLEIRGPGDFLGTRQAGLPEFRTASILRHAAILEAARKEAFALLDDQPDLFHLNPQLKEELEHRWGGRLEMAAIA